MFDIFNVAENDLGGIILVEITKHIRFIENGLVTEADELGKPTFSPSAQSRMATQSAPDWEKNAMEPEPGCPAAKEAFTPALVFIMPRQLGPSSAISFFSQISRIFCSR